MHLQGFILFLLFVSHCVADRKPRQDIFFFDTPPPPTRGSVEFSTNCRSPISSGTPVLEVAGGTDAVEGAFPWIARIGNDPTSFFCGGALYTNQHVLTAAHCVNRIAKYVVRLGDHDGSENFSANRLDIQVSTVIIHPGYTKTRNVEKNDIALLKLITPVRFLGGDFGRIRPVCLPHPFEPIIQPEGQKVTVAGWGTLSFGGAFPPIIQFADLTVQSQVKCVNAYRSIRVTIDDSVICAGGDGKDACGGDSGGPLTYVNHDGNVELVGLVSFGYKCADPRYPGVFTRVTSFMDWITKNTI